MTNETNRREDDELTAFGYALARRHQPAPSAEFRARLRRSLMTVPATIPAVPRFAWLSLRPALAAAAAIAIVFAGAGVAAADSLAGDPAFGIKTAVEQLEVALAPNDNATLHALVAQADRRLVELRMATARRPESVHAASVAYLAAVQRVQAALPRVLAEPPSDARDSAVTDAAQASESHLEILQELKQRLPDAAQPGIDRAIDAQQTVHGSSGDVPKPRTPAPARPTPTPRR